MSQSSGSPDQTNWPIVYKEVLIVGNPESNVGICGLWTHRKGLARKLDANYYAILGNLYGTEGISPIIRNVYANPHIRYLVLWGNDLSGSGDALAEFMQAGVNGDHRTPSGAVQIEREIPAGAIEQFRESVSLIDLRGQPFEAVQETIASLPALPPFGEPRSFPVAEDEIEGTRPELCPSEWTGFRVGDETVAQTWLRLLHLIMRFGRHKHTRYGVTNKLREVLNLTAVVTSEDPDDVYLPDYLSLTHDQLEAYYPQVLEAISVEGASYSYGERLRDYENIDQIDVMADLLARRPSSKRMYATTWKVAVDAQNEQGDAPCLTQLNGSVQDNCFLLTAHFRSQDMFGAWPLNAFAVRKLQAQIAAAADVPLGPLTIITHSAHIYAWDWDKARDLLKQYDRIVKPAAEMDPRGYAIIRLNGDEIEAGLYDYANTLIDKITGQSARRVSREIVRRMWTADAGHALYLGQELMKAEVALRTNTAYVQDTTLEL